MEMMVRSPRLELLIPDGRSHWLWRWLDAIAKRKILAFAMNKTVIYGGG
jgi:hypothetical protein